MTLAAQRRRSTRPTCAAPAATAVAGADGRAQPHAAAARAVRAGARAGALAMPVPQPETTAAAALAGRPRRLAGRILDRPQSAARAGAALPGRRRAHRVGGAAGRRWFDPAGAARSAGPRSCPTWPTSRPTCSTRWRPRSNCWRTRRRHDDALYFFRMALFHEDLRGEQLRRWRRRGRAAGAAIAAGRAPRARRCCCRPRAGRWAGPRPASRSTSSAGATSWTCPSSRSTRSP
jgi:hypothetical protein